MVRCWVGVQLAEFVFLWVGGEVCGDAGAGQQHVNVGKFGSRSHEVNQSFYRVWAVVLFGDAKGRRAARSALTGLCSCCDLRELFSNLVLDAAQQCGHSDDPQRAHERLQSQLSGKITGELDNLFCAEVADAFAEYTSKAAGGGCFSRRQNVHRCARMSHGCCGDFYHDVNRGLAFNDAVHEGRIGAVWFGDLSHFGAKLDEEFEPGGWGKAEELSCYFRQICGERHVSHRSRVRPMRRSC